MKRDVTAYRKGLLERIELSTYAAGLSVRTGAIRGARRHARRANRLQNLLARLECSA